MSWGHKRILIVCHYYPPHIGGIEIVAHSEAQRLAALGNAVTVITSKTPGDPPSGMYEGVRVIRVPAFNGLEKKGIPFPLFSPTMLVHLWRVTRRADIVHIHDVFYLSSSFAALIAWLQRRPTVITQHVALVPHPSKLTGPIERLVFKTSGRWMLQRSSRIVTINSRVRDFLVQLGVNTDKIVAMTNGVDMKQFRPPTVFERQTARKRYGLPKDAFIVLFIGRFVPKKGFDVLRQIASDEYLLVFVGGDGEAFHDDARQHFLGRMPHAELQKLYWAADLFVLPSYGEGFPLTAQEAMACGTPVVLKYDHGYKQYNLKSHQITYFKGSKANELKRVIRHLQKDGEKRRALSENARQYVYENFSWDGHMVTLSNMYAEVLNAKGLTL